ncbi:rod-binding protein [Thiomicrorhabdus sp. zzn3]|uniref:rod-binding protein n=1 Tax=Thiomicrorhabdus sp. zzn3 TaxID=3039775 RepID=UPI0024366EC2|nr:rod-binding protein [Thiomicrorhabdus sp. zzn3]MDG6777602.1 rod-binding protein [Thiomicrorhabdus sp. zzn3]
MMGIQNSSDLLSGSQGGLKNYQNYADIGALNDLKKQAREDERAALRPVAEQFEALFVQQILKEARKVSFDDGWLDGNQGDFYKDWYDKQLAQDLAAKGTLGFADNIVEQLAPRDQGVSKWPTEAKADAVDSTQQVLALRKIK